VVQLANGAQGRVNVAPPSSKSKIRFQRSSVFINEGGVDNAMTKTIRQITGGVALAAALFFASGTPVQLEAKEKTLYHRLGGKKAIVAVVDQFVGNVAGDKRINGFFAATAADPQRLAKFKMNLVDQICMATGGPCKYTGKDMKSAHAGMGVTTGDFNALVEDLSAALDKFKVGEREKGELLGALGSMKSDIVEKP
jgi:hemoglobin